MATSKWVYRVSDSLFLRGGFYDPAYDSAHEGVVSFQDADPHPDVETERYDATSSTKRRPATQAELDIATATRIDTEARKSIDEMRAIKTAILTSLWGRLGRQPTAVEIATERTRFVEIYKTLGR